MLRSISTITAVTRKIIILALSFLCLMSAAILGLLTSYEAENKAAKTGAEISQLRKEKTELQAKVGANQNEIASLQKRIEDGVAATKPSENPSVEPAPKQQSTPLPPSLEIKLGAASTPEQPTPPPQSLEIKPEHVEETTPPPQRPKPRKMTPIKAPQVAGQPGTMSTSSAKALATYAPAPSYPAKARLDGITGSGVCAVSVDPGSGRVTEASMAQSTGNPQLDKAALRTFRKWRFKPGTVSTVRIPIEFKP
jgi:TonB family protein